MNHKLQTIAYIRSYILYLSGSYPHLFRNPRFPGPVPGVSETFSDDKAPVFQSAITLTVKHTHRKRISTLGISRTVFEKSLLLKSTNDRYGM